MSELFAYVTFILTAGIPLLAIIGELHHHTPTSVSYSIVRSIICLGSLFFMSSILNITYHGNMKDMLIVGFIFLISCVQFYLELHGENIDDVFEFPHKNTKTH